MLNLKCLRIQKCAPSVDCLGLNWLPPPKYSRTRQAVPVWVFVPVYLGAGGKESITGAEIIPAGDLSPLMTRLLRHLSLLPWLIPSIHPSVRLSLSPPRILPSASRCPLISCCITLFLPRLCFVSSPDAAINSSPSKGLMEKKGRQREVAEPW